MQFYQIIKPTYSIIPTLWFQKRKSNAKYLLLTVLFMRGIALQLNKIRPHGRKGFLNVTILNSRQFIQAQFMQHFLLISPVVLRSKSFVLLLRVYMYLFMLCARFG